MTTVAAQNFWARRPSQKAVNTVIIVLTALAIGVAGCSIITEAPTWSWPVIGLVDVYLLIVLWVSAYRSYDQQAAKKHPWIVALFPSRPAGLFVMFGLIAATVVAFASLYADGTCVFGRTLHKSEAIYISFSTLGFNDFMPKGIYGRLVVMLHLASAVLLIMGVFALLISRLSTFETPDLSEEAPTKAFAKEAVAQVLETDFGKLMTTQSDEITQLKDKLETAQSTITELQKAALAKSAGSTAPKA